MDQNTLPESIYSPLLSPSHIPENSVELRIIHFLKKEKVEISDPCDKKYDYWKKMRTNQLFEFERSQNSNLLKRRQILTRLNVLTTN